MGLNQPYAAACLIHLDPQGPRAAVELLALVHVPGSRRAAVRSSGLLAPGWPHVMAALGVSRWLERVTDSQPRTVIVASGAAPLRYETRPGSGVCRNWLAIAERLPGAGGVF